MTSAVQTRSPSELSGVRRIAQAGYRWLLVLFLVACGAQIFLAGLGVFSFGGGDSAGGASAFDAHRALGFALGGAAVLILIVALLARPGVLPLVLAGLLVVQANLLQSLLAGLADNTALYGGLHALDGVLILASAGVQYALARRHRP
jgi:Mn2+/Fe2+ NRAMP family transporter